MRRGRRIAEVQSQRKSLEVIHLNRSAEVGALSASFAHELGQPLTAILVSADTVKNFLEEDPSKIERVKQIITATFGTRVSMRSKWSDVCVNSSGAAMLSWRSSTSVKQSQMPCELFHRRRAGDILLSGFINPINLS